MGFYDSELALQQVAGFFLPFTSSSLIDLPLFAATSHQEQCSTCARDPFRNGQRSACAAGPLCSAQGGKQSIPMHVPVYLLSFKWYETYSIACVFTSHRTCLRQSRASHQTMIKHSMQKEGSRPALLARFPLLWTCLRTPSLLT